MGHRRSKRSCGKKAAQNALSDMAIFIKMNVKYIEYSWVDSAGSE